MSGRKWKKTVVTSVKGNKDLQPGELIFHFKPLCWFDLKNKNTMNITLTKHSTLV